MKKKTTLAIAEDLQLPLDAVTQPLAFLARRGAGKTYGATKLAEEMLLAGAQIVALDPVGVWAGLRLAADGKSPGLPIPIFGGERGDLPLAVDSGALVARLIVEKGISVVLDVSSFRKEGRRTFMTAFAEELFHLKKTARSPLHLFIEEAQVFVPQRAQKGEERLLGAMEDICRLGRNYGMGFTLISQRPQSINKEVLNQVEGLFVMQINGPHEREAIRAWIIEKGLDTKLKSELVDDLPRLPIGEAFLWSPSWLGILKKIHIAKKTTFDASATPEVGKTAARGGQLATIDLEEVRVAMAAVVERQERDDPKALHRRIRELEKKLAGATAIQPSVPGPAFDAAAAEGHLRHLRAELAEIATKARKLADDATAADHWVSNLQELVREVPANSALSPRREPAARPATPAPAAPRPVKPTVARDGVSVPQQRILDSLGWLESVGLDSAAKVQLAFLAGQSPKSSGFANNLGALRSKGLIDYPTPGVIALTDAGRRIADQPDEAPTTTELQERVLSRLSAPQGRILRAVIDRYPDPMTKHDVALMSSQSVTSSGFANNLGFLRSLGLIDYPQTGLVQAQPVLFLEEA